MTRVATRCFVAGLAVMFSAGCKRIDPAKANDGTIMTPYLVIGDVLAGDEVDYLSELAAAVLHGVEAEPDAPGVDEISQGAGRLGAQDIATARSAFRTMSRGVIKYTKADPTKQDGNSIIHCNMTFNGDGAAWVQRSGEVMNPYEGAMMLHCGDLIAWDADVPQF